MKKGEILETYFGVYNVDDVWTNDRNIDLVIDWQGLRDVPPVFTTLQEQQAMRLTILMSDIDSPFRLRKDSDYEDYRSAESTILKGGSTKWKLAFVAAKAGRKTRFRLYYLHHSLFPHQISLQNLEDMLSENALQYRRKVCVFDQIAENFFALLEVGEDLAYVLERRDAGDPNDLNSFAAITEIRRIHQGDKGVAIQKVREVQRITSNTGVSNWELGHFLNKLSVNALGVVTNPNFSRCWSMPYHREFPNGWK